MEPIIPDICDRLRADTADAHERLEQDLGLLQPPLSRARFARLLQRFHAFHRAWEPAVAARLADPAFFEPRRRLALLEADLAALGCPAGQADGTPAAVDRLTVSVAAAWGSLYVLEGSTMGGQIIARRLAGETWLPAGGLRYFTPYESAGPMWQAFRARIRAVSSPGADPEILASARATFALLHAWLRPAFAVPA